MPLFLSTYINKIDKKGRVSVPAAFRLLLVHPTTPGMAVFRSLKLPVLEGSRIERLQQISQSIDQLDIFSQAQDDLTAAIFADAQILPFDGEGRVTLPKELLDFASITDRVAFVGRGASFQIWQPDAFSVHQQQARQRLLNNADTLKLKLAEDKKDAS